MRVIRKCVRLSVEGHGKQGAAMRAVAVYRLDDGSNTGYRTRHPIGCLLELRKYERGNNVDDLIET